MYMLKLRHKSFGNSAGTCWRLLFIYALMPWMRKYRKYDDSLDIADFKFAANRMWTGRMPPRSTLFQEDPDEELSVKKLGIQVATLEVQEFKILSIVGADTANPSDNDMFLRTFLLSIIMHF